MAKPIKIYTSKGHYIKASLSMEKIGLGKIAKMVSWIFDFFYRIGSALIKFSKLAFNAAALLIFHLIKKVKQEAKKTKLLWPQRQNIFNQKQFSYGLLVFIVIAGIGWVGLGALRLVAKAIAIKTSVSQTATLGNNYLAQAKDALFNQDFGQAENRFALAFTEFNQGQQELADSGVALNQLMNLLPQKQAADKLLSAASLISDAGVDFISLQNQIQSLQIGPSGISSQTEDVVNSLNLINSQLSQIVSKTTAAEKLVSGVDENALPQNYKEQFAELKTKLEISEVALNNFYQVFSLAKNILLGNKNLLVLFENNNELRATGGFIGSYGDLKISNGQIQKMTVSSIYDLDGQLADVIQPPQPLLGLTGSWYMRDSNWFADFPMSAKKVSSFYEKEGGETTDAVLAITPNLIMDLLKITGPIYLQKYNVTLNSDNFVEQTQAITTMSDNLPTNEPKQLLADFIPIFLTKISSSGGLWPQIIQALQNNLTEKQIVIYSRDPQIQSQLENFHWSGDIEPTDRDYVSVVSSNLGGTKTDLEIDQKINLTTTIATDGTVTNELDITRTNKMPDLPSTNNNSFLRVYVPLGSKLISALGFDYRNLDYPTNENYKIDDDVYAWEKNSVTDNLTGTMIGQESGKTFFGNWLNVKGGDSRTVKLVYQLPFKLSSIDRYSLLVQKQIGSTDSNFNWQFNFPQYKIDWKNFDPDSLNTADLSSAIILNKDYFLGMVLEKR